MKITSSTSKLFILALTAVPGAVNSVIIRLFHSMNAHLVDTRLDPLVNPNSCSTHVHSVFGSVKFASTISRDDFRDLNWQNDTGKVNQTTSHIIPNRSMYWAPSLYIFNAVDQLYYIVPTFSRTYYRIEYRGGDISNIKPIPQFLQMLAGQASRKTEWSLADVHDNISWTVRSNRQETTSINNGDWRYLREDPQLVANEDQLEMNIAFPNCLKVYGDGTPVISSPDFRSHASYMNSTNVCPKEFPYHIPIVNLEVRYDLEAMRELLGRDVVDNIDNWTLSTMDKSGASAHADFVSGWPEDLMKNAIQYCRRNQDITGKNQCLVEKYFAIDNNFAERRYVPFNDTTKLPDETISPVPQIPQGTCPNFI